jgi:hypothetical protein
MALIAYLLARAEAGEIGTARQGRKLTTAAWLKPLETELAAWGLSGEVAPAIERLWRGGWLVEDEAGFLRPTAVTFTWLQLPPALVFQTWLADQTWLQLPFTLELAVNLIKYGVVPDASNTTGLGRLTLAGLLYVEEGARLRAFKESGKLLTALASETPAARDETGQFDLDQLWRDCYPGGWPEKGWLRWEQTDLCYSFALSSPGKPFSYHPWQLFRLLSLGRPRPGRAGSEETGRLFLEPDRKRFSGGVQAGLNPALARLYLGQGLRGNFPESLAKTVKEWRTNAGQLVVRDLTMLEAADRHSLADLLSDRQVRPYLKRLLSPRHAVVEPENLKRLALLLKRRNQHLEIATREALPRKHRGGLNLQITRRQFGQLYTALLFYRQHLAQNDFETVELALLANILGENLTMAERNEAEQLADQLLKELTAAPESLPYETPPDEAEMERTRQRLEDALEAGQPVWIEYRAPGRAAQARQVEPHQIYVDDGLIYLRAYCYLRRGDRTFRLDRLKLSEPPRQG